MLKPIKILTRIVVAITIVMLTQCTDYESNTDESISKPNIANIKGYAQKGPFINGSSVMVFDLQTDLSPSGKAYNAQIKDNNGTFQLSNISLSSSYINVRADGFYFNEVSGRQSVAQITLYALSDITGKTNLNVNLLTHLEKARVEFLMQGGKSFVDSKIHAQKEILAIFNIEKSDIKTSENLNIAENGSDNGILLAISSIIQGYRSESEMTELLSNISNDIKEDGILNSDILGSALISHAIVLDSVSIKTNLEQRYKDIGSTADLPVFGKYLANFIAKTEFVATKSLISYPEKGLHGFNILSLSKTHFIASWNTSLSMAANLAKETALKIKVSALDTTIRNVNGMVPRWGQAMGFELNWSISRFDEKNYSQTYTAIDAGKSCDLLLFFDEGSFIIEYFEMNSLKPTRTKIVTCKNEN